MILEDSGIHIKHYIDENRDGHFDNSRLLPRRTQSPGRDRFIDDDGDGVSDGRGFFRHKRLGNDSERHPGNK